jgi:hypothetical protein
MHTAKCNSMAHGKGKRTANFQWRLTANCKLTANWKEASSCKAHGKGKPTAKLHTRHTAENNLTADWR